MPKRLSHSKIEYITNPDGSPGYMWGIWSGCHNWRNGICGGGGQDFNCWAKTLVARSPKNYPDGFEPHYYPEAINSPMKLKKPSIIGVGWVGEVIGYGVNYKEEIFDTIFNCPQHTFLFLTKNPERLPDWSPFPDNCRVVATATDDAMFQSAIYYLGEIEAKVKYISFEPLFSPIDCRQVWDTRIQRILDWVIIGAQTKPTVMPKLEWVREIVEACDKAGIPVFLKKNLNPLFAETTTIKDKWVFSKTNFMKGEFYRQEMPK